jgi:hypothetical protein
MIVNNVLQFFNKQTKTIIIVDVVHHRHRSRKHGFRKRLAAFRLGYCLTG